MLHSKLCRKVLLLVHPRCLSNVGHCSMEIAFMFWYGSASAVVVDVLPFCLARYYLSLFVLISVQM